MTIPPKSQPAFGSAPTDFGGFGETLFTERGHSTVANGFAAPSPPAKSFPNLGRTPRVQVFGSVVEVEDHRLHTREVRAEPIFDPRPPVAATLVRGINLVTLAWSDGDLIDPTDYRLVDPPMQSARRTSGRTSCQTVSGSGSSRASSREKASWAGASGSMYWRSVARGGFIPPKPTGATISRKAERPQLREYFVTMLDVLKSDTSRNADLPMRPTPPHLRF